MPTVAEELAKKQRSISVAEFFERNKHLLGFDSKRKSILTCIKEAVDNALDACEEMTYGLKSKMEKETNLEKKKILEEEYKKSLPNILVKIEKYVDEHKVIDSSGKTVGKIVFTAEGEDILKLDSLYINFNVKRTKEFKIKTKEGDISIRKINDEYEIEYNKKKYITQAMATSIFCLSITDNGPGIVKEKISNIFGSLLYGSKFHRLKQSRGQQGIGISSSVMYGQLTTGKPAKIISKIDKNADANVLELKIDVQKNEPEIINESKSESFPFEHGTQVNLIIEGVYISKGDKSVYEYLKRTSIANPHAKLEFTDPEGEKILFSRNVNTFPDEPTEIKPHPYGLELGILMRMLKNTDRRNISSFLSGDFSRIGSTSAKSICKNAHIELDTKPSELDTKSATALLHAMQKEKLMRPPTDCLSPIGEEGLKKSMTAELKPEFVVALTREPEVYNGRPFLIEVGLAYGGEYNEKKSEVIRFANKVPLLYHSSDCVTNEAISEVDWRRYGVSQSGGSGTPTEPIYILIHMASVWIPFTSEGKQAIASYEEIKKEMKLALMECARSLGAYLKRKNKAARQSQRMSTFVKYADRTAGALADLSDIKKYIIEKLLLDLIKTKVKVLGTE